MIEKIYNFGAGPAKIPDEVLRQAHAEFFNWQNTGMSILEIGHRTEDYLHFQAQTENNLRTLLKIPSHYKVLFFSGGATSQFAIVPLNLSNRNTIADYLITGIWSEKAHLEAQKYCQVSIAASGKNNN